MVKSLEQVKLQESITTLPPFFLCSRNTKTQIWIKLTAAEATMCSKEMSSNIKTRLDNHCGRSIACEKLDRVANWVGNSVVTVFFASLERCYCINLSTVHDDIDEEDDDYIYGYGHADLSNTYRRPLLPRTRSTAFTS